MVLEGGVYIPALRCVSGVGGVGVSLPYDALVVLVVLEGGGGCTCTCTCISLPYDALVVFVVLEGGVYPCLMMCWWGWWCWRGGGVSLEESRGRFLR